MPSSRRSPPLRKSRQGLKVRRPILGRRTGSLPHRFRREPAPCRFFSGKNVEDCFLRRTVAASIVVAIGIGRACARGHGRARRRAGRRLTRGKRLLEAFGATTIMVVVMERLCLAGLGRLLQLLQPLLLQLPQVRLRPRRIRAGDRAHGHIMDKRGNPPRWDGRSPSPAKSAGQVRQNWPERR